MGGCTRTHSKKGYIVIIESTSTDNHCELQKEVVVIPDLRNRSWPLNIWNCGGLSKTQDHSPEGGIDASVKTRTIEVSINM